MLIRGIAALMLVGYAMQPAWADECNRKYIEFVRQMAHRQQLAGQERSGCAQMQAIQALAHDYIEFYRMCPSVDPTGHQRQMQQQIIQTPVAAQCAAERNAKPRAPLTQRQTGKMKKAIDAATK